MPCATDVMRRAADRGEISADAVTRIRVSAGPALVLARHLTSGPLSSHDVAAIVDEIVLASLR